MICVKTSIPLEELARFYAKTGHHLKDEIELYYMYDEVLEEYYLGFADDMIVIRNTSMTLDNGTVTEESLDLEIVSHDTYIKKAESKMSPEFNTLSAGISNG